MWPKAFNKTFFFLLFHSFTGMGRPTKPTKPTNAGAAGRPLRQANEERRTPHLVASRARLWHPGKKGRTSERNHNYETITKLRN